MSDVPAFVTDLVDKRAKAQGRMKRAEATYAAAKKDFEDLDVALSVLTKHGYVPAESPVRPSESLVSGAAEEQMNENYLLLLHFIPGKADWAVAPKFVTGRVHAKGRDDLSADYIRTALWRMAQRGILESTGDGKYWRNRKVEAPDAETSEASKKLGPLGGERGFPPTAPEGSIPSGSTHVQPASFDTDLDDDVPF